jgi:hypothetical protein
MKRETRQEEEELERHAVLYDSADLHHAPGICFTCRTIAEMRGDA